MMNLFSHLRYLLLTFVLIASRKLATADSCYMAQTASSGLECPDNLHYCSSNGQQCCQNEFKTQTWCCSSDENVTCDTKSSLNQCSRDTGGSGSITTAGIPCGENMVCTGSNVQCCTDGSNHWCCQSPYKCSTSPNMCDTPTNSTSPGSSTEAGISCSSGTSSTVCQGSNMICCNKDFEPFCCNSDEYNQCGNGGVNQCIKHESIPGSTASRGRGCSRAGRVCSGDAQCCSVGGIPFCCPQFYKCSEIAPFYCYEQNGKECKSNSSDDPFCCSESTDVCCSESNSCCSDGETCCNGHCCNSGAKCCGSECCDADVECCGNYSFDKTCCTFGTKCENGKCV